MVSNDEYTTYLQFKASQTSSSATIAHTGHSKVCFLKSSLIGPWVLDSGAPEHVLLVIHHFYQKYPNLKPHITLVDGSNAKASGIGQATSLQLSI